MVLIRKTMILLLMVVSAPFAVLAASPPSAFLNENLYLESDANSGLIKSGVTVYQFAAEGLKPGVWSKAGQEWAHTSTFKEKSTRKKSVEKVQFGYAKHENANVAVITAIIINSEKLDKHSIYRHVSDILPDMPSVKHNAENQRIEMQKKAEQEKFKHDSKPVYNELLPIVGNLRLDDTVATAVDKIRKMPGVSSITWHNDLRYIFVNGKSVVAPNAIELLANNDNYDEALAGYALGRSAKPTWNRYEYKLNIVFVMNDVNFKSDLLYVGGDDHPYFFKSMHMESTSIKPDQVSELMSMFKGICSKLLVKYDNSRELECSDYLENSIKVFSGGGNANDLKLNVQYDKSQSLFKKEIASYLEGLKNKPVEADVNGSGAK
ncbi:MAG: hypothetical protein A2X82_02735 [Geobacteraceae bacterium GWC2_55_20]|nr:MAG: hypothetical protein A2X82_02735 [Geobacteraceae bacterium GWC2_55_20]OGU19882.1 MAG: hypothetical protein A2X85_01510 [Geobacteraceae bacterium GWF2_54_21]HBA72070.1 hypothetical protein [Geobacter sp.]HCE67138.1 hypothetical protein [Geobacter sp.]